MTNILFLAQFAPTNGIVLNPPKTSEEKFYAETYHWKIVDILQKSKYNIDTASDVDYLIKNHDKYQLVWSVYNRLGFRNSEIFVQSLCEYYNIKYIGATPNVRALVEDKSMSKQLAEHLGLKTAPWVVCSKEYPLCKIAPFPGPYFVKPRFGSASINIDESSLCHSWKDAIAKSKLYAQQNIDVIVEKYIKGICYGVSLINTISGNPLIAPPHYTVSHQPFAKPLIPDMDSYLFQPFVHGNRKPVKCAFYCRFKAQAVLFADNLRPAVMLNNFLLPLQKRFCLSSV